MNNQEEKTASELEVSPVEEKKHVPLWAWIFLGIAAFSVVIYVIAWLSEPFADFYNRYIGSLLRGALSYLTVWIPFSFAEFLLLLLPLILVYLIIFAYKKYTGSWRDVGIYALSVVSALSMLFSIFVLGFGTGYHGSTLDQKLGLDRKDVSPAELRDTALWLVAELQDVKDINYASDDFSVMPYSYEELNSRLMEAYSDACEKYDFISPLYSRIKTVMLSEPMTYTHISGVYTYFTGEANININFPNYTIPYTAAHELAHQRGIAREDEANFVAFLVCLESDDEYIRYSAYLNVCEYVLSALSRADRTAYSDVIGRMPAEIRREMSAYSDFFDKYRENVVASVSGAVNNTYLTMQGTPGTKSYGMVVDLAVAYFKAGAYID